MKGRESRDGGGEGRGRTENRSATGSTWETWETGRRPVLHGAAAEKWQGHLAHGLEDVNPARGIWNHGRDARATLENRSATGSTWETWETGRRPVLHGAGLKSGMGILPMGSRR